MIVPELLDESIALTAVVCAAFTGFYVSAVVGIGGALVLLPVLMIWLPPATAVALAALLVITFEQQLDGLSSLFSPPPPPPPPANWFGLF